MRLHGQGVRDIARAENLHARAGAPLDEPGLGQGGGIDHRVRGEAVESLEINDGVLGLPAPGEEPALAQPAVERHLAALEAAPLPAARRPVLASLTLPR